MMISIIRQNDNISTYVTEFLVDNESDISSINTKRVDPGSTCLVAATGDVYILNNEKQWKKL